MLLVTPTLLNGFRWFSHFYGDEPEEETIERDNFLSLLRREPMQFEGEALAAILKGRDLEQNVVSYCEQPYEGAPLYIETIGKLVMGGMWQQAVKRPLDGKYLLYGRTDHMRADTISDVKYCGMYEVGRFIRSAQHRIYLYCSGLPVFRYVGCDRFNEVFVEHYYNHAGIEEELRGMIHDFLGYLEGDAEAKDLFYTNWRAKE